MNEDLIEQMDFARPKSRRSKFSSLDKLEDKYSEVGYIWRRMRGYELFLYHYVRRNHKVPIYHPSKMNLVKTIVSNVFLNVELLKVIISKYNVDDRCIYDSVGGKFMEISIDSSNEVFKLIDRLTKRLSFIELNNEYKILDISYMQWKIVMYKIVRG